MRISDWSSDVCSSDLTPRAGRLEVPAAGRRGGVAYVLQATHVNEHLPLTVRETVTMGRYAHTGPLRRLGADDRAVVERSMDALGISDLAALPLHELSSGQRQRDRKSTPLNSSHYCASRIPSSA